MWPWEHLAFAYLVASLGARVLTDWRPDWRVFVTIAVASQLPDLIDKPLAWTFDILPSGLTLGHSLLFATPLCLLVLVGTARLDRRLLGVVFGLAYGSHLAGDVLFFFLTSGSLPVGFLFWPVVPASPDPGVGFLTRVDQLAGRFWRFLASPRGRLYIAFEALLLVSATIAWIWDLRLLTVHPDPS